MNQHSRPLEGIRVLEVGQLLAGPFAGSILGYYGAEVIKVEAPGAGDPLRKSAVMHFLLRPRLRHQKDVPSSSSARHLRSGSPSPGASTLITSAL